MSVWANISSLALRVLDPAARATARSIGLSFQRLVGSSMRAWKRRSCSVVADGEPVLDEHDAGANEHPLELRAGAQELLVLVVGAEAHHALDAGAVVPAAVEQDDLAGGRQVRDVALEVPLRASRARWARQAPRRGRSAG